MCDDLLAFLHFEFTRKEIEGLAREIDPNFELTREYVSQLDDELCKKIAKKLNDELIGLR